MFNEKIKEQECEDLRKDIADAGNLNLALSDFLHIRVFPPLTLVCFFYLKIKKTLVCFFLFEDENLKYLEAGDRCPPEDQ